MLLDEAQLFLRLLPFSGDLNQNEIQILKQNAKLISFHAGESIHSANDCTGAIIVKSGQLRNYILSEQGKEITLYRLTPGDFCILSASCILKNINFDIHIDAEKNSSIFLIPSGCYAQIKNQNASVAAFTYELVNERFSNTMWVMEQIVFMSFDKRLSIFLLDQSAMEGSQTLFITHDAIARHMGTAREVVTRMLKYFQNEGLVSLSRGTIILLDKKRLLALTA